MTWTCSRLTGLLCPFKNYFVPKPSECINLLSFSELKVIAYFMMKITAGLKLIKVWDWRQWVVKFYINIFVSGQAAIFHIDKMTCCPISCPLSCLRPITKFGFIFPQFLGSYFHNFWFHISTLLSFLILCRFVQIARVVFSCILGVRDALKYIFRYYVCWINLDYL